MYDMYHYHRGPVAGMDEAAPGAVRGTRAARHRFAAAADRASAARAVQVALDRRDNGGDSAAAPEA